MSTVTAGSVLATRPVRSAVERRRPPLLSFALVAVAFTILVGLGVWQVQRLGWKTRLIAHVAALQGAPPRPLASVLAQLSRGEDVDFTRAEASCPTLEATPTLRLYALQETMGYRLITACPLSGSSFRSILVDRGFVAREDVGKVRTNAEALTGSIAGVLRTGDKPGWFTPKHAAAGADWYGRDIPAMAAELGAPAPAPIFLMLERPAPRGFGPTPAPLPGEISNPHLGYAITWFGLAAALVGVYAAAVLRRRRRA